MEKFKIEVILKSSPEKVKPPTNRNNKYPKQGDRNSDVLYGRSSSVPIAPDNSIDLRSKIVGKQQCMTRPYSQKQKESQMFTEKCLEILSRKKSSFVGATHEHRNKMKNMMSNIVDKYKQDQSEIRLSDFGKNSLEAMATIPRATASSQLSGAEDKIQVYRMIKSTEIEKPDISSRNKKSVEKCVESLDWRTKPDVTGVRVNNRILKSNGYDFQGVTCFSLSLAEVPLLKRHSMIIPQTNAFQPRTFSSNSSRRKISINRISSQKFMAFNLNSDPDGLYMKKLKSYLDFIFKVNYSNRIYISLQISEDTSAIRKHKVYIGPGNNSLLIKSLLKRRFWLEIVEDVEEEGINFYWTQNKISRVHNRQPNSKTARVVYKSSKYFESHRRNESKSLEEKELIDLNKKILPNHESRQVEKFVCKDGFLMPFDDKYECAVITNHIPQNTCIGSKKNLFKSLYCYYRDYLKTDPFNYIPKTYNVKNPEDPEFKKFLKEYSGDPDKVWIVKPGENSNRGNGIKLAPTKRVIQLIRKREKHAGTGLAKTYIIQSYIDKPFLYNSRKFDIRHYMLLTSVNGIIKAYWYKEGYIRTSSQKFDLHDLSNEVIHLTNDAIQKAYEDYQKYEPGNKLSYSQFQRYLDMVHPSKTYSFEKDIIPKMRSIMVDVIKANYNVIDKNRRECNFQIFGFDFMIDREFKPWLIEVNFNPCYEMGCPLLARVIPTMVENSLRIGLDPLLPPLNHYPVNKRYTLSDNYLKNLKYELMFDEHTFTETIPDLYDIEDSDDEEEEYNDEGKQIEELIF